MSFSSGEKGKERSWPSGYSILPRMMSVGRSIFREVGIRNSDLGMFELMWNPEATRKFSGTMVCVARSAVTSPTGTIETEGALPDCANAAPASKAKNATNAGLGLGGIMLLQFMVVRRPKDRSIVEGTRYRSYCQL